MPDKIKNALIIGDSWSTVTVWLHSHAHLGLYHDKDLHLFPEFQLENYGVNVKNTGMGGGNNLSQLQQALVQNVIFERLGRKYDLIIWYHTELLRDWGRPHPNAVAEMKALGLDRYLNKLAEETYIKASNIKKKFPHTTWVIVGGHCAIKSSHRHLLEWADLIIDNWRQELSGTECPECHTLSFINEFETYSNMFPSDIVERELDKRDKIVAACQNPEVFYDKVHPSPKSQGVLSDRIINFLKETGKI